MCIRDRLWDHGLDPDDAGAVAEAAPGVGVTAMRNTLMAWPIALLAALHGSSAWAQSQFDPKQLAMLPAYCKYTQLYRQNVPGGNDPQQIERWTSICLLYTSDAA